MKDKSTLVKTRTMKQRTQHMTMPVIGESSSTASASPSLFGSTFDDSDSSENEYYEKKTE